MLVMFESRGREEAFEVDVDANVLFFSLRRKDWNEILQGEMESLRGISKLDGEIFLVKGAGECKHSYSSRFNFLKTSPCFIFDFLAVFRFEMAGEMH